jgi:hypothetical protein
MELVASGLPMARLAGPDKDRLALIAMLAAARRPFGRALGHLRPLPQLAALRLMPFRNATVDSFLSAAFSSFRLVVNRRVTVADAFRPCDRSAIAGASRARPVRRQPAEPLNYAYQPFLGGYRPMY